MHTPLGMTDAQASSLNSMFGMHNDRGLNAAELSSAAPSAAGAVVGFLVHAAIAGTAGYFVGKQTGSPVGTAAASAIFGLPGMFIATILAPKDVR